MSVASVRSVQRDVPVIAEHVLSDVPDAATTEVRDEALVATDLSVDVVSAVSADSDGVSAVRAQGANDSTIDATARQVSVVLDTPSGQRMRARTRDHSSVVTSVAHALVDVRTIVSTDALSDVTIASADVQTLSVVAKAATVEVSLEIASSRLRGQT